MITPYFGRFPEWFHEFEPPKGYDWLLDVNLNAFKKRVKDKLGFEFPGFYGSPKIWDYRSALGLLYEEEIKDYNYWGHMDFDVVWGDMERFLPDSELSKFDVYSSHDGYVCGCFSLYRNDRFGVNNLFREYPHWMAKMVGPETTGWVEQEYSSTLEKSGLRYAYTFNQGDPWTKVPILKRERPKLFQDMNAHADVPDPRWEEIMFFHFRHSKRWPL